MATKTAAGRATGVNKEGDGTMGAPVVATSTFSKGAAIVDDGTTTDSA